MGKWLLCMVASTAACLPIAGSKMAWPAEPKPTSSDAPTSLAVGGGLETKPMRSTVRRVVHHNSDAVGPAGASASGPRYLVLQWPFSATGVNSLYGKRTDPLDGAVRNHNGVDLEAAYGAVVSAASKGVVIWAGWNAGHGRQVIVEHEGGFRTGYSHLSQVLTYVGAAVDAGDPLGLVGNSGRSTGPHLHFEILRDDVYLDPLDVLGVPQLID